jgi:hypothetical protein
MGRKKSPSSWHEQAEALKAEAEKLSRQRARSAGEQGALAIVAGPLAANQGTGRLEGRTAKVIKKSR